MDERFKGALDRFINLQHEIQHHKGRSASWDEWNRFFHQHRITFDPLLPCTYAEWRAGMMIAYAAVFRLWLRSH